LQAINLRIPDEIVAEVPNLREMVENWSEDEEDLVDKQDVCIQNTCNDDGSLLHRNNGLLDTDVEEVMDVVVGVSASTDQFDEVKMQNALSQKKNRYLV
jgi:hypothetical protein